MGTARDIDVIENIKKDSNYATKVTCPRCDGKGTTKEHPYYSNPMPEKTDCRCLKCDGLGSVLIIKTDMRIYPCT